MKKILSAILVCVLLCGTLFTLASCGNSLSGTYASDEIDIGVAKSKVTLKFGLASVTIESMTENIVTGAKTTTYKASYKIAKNDEGERTITFTYAADSNEFDLFPDGNTFKFDEATTDDGEQIKIGVYTFTKAK